MFSRNILRNKYTIESEQIFEKPNMLYLPQIRFTRCKDIAEKQQTGYCWGFTLGYLSVYKNYIKET